MTRRAAALLAAFLFAGCTDSAPPPAVLEAPPAPKSALEQRLDREAAARPAGTLRVEDVVAKLGEAGIVVTRVRQVLARNLGARYCATVHTARGPGVAVCEFDSPEAARAGEQRSRELFDRFIPDRRLVVAQSTLVTVNPGGAEPKYAADVIAALSL
jgi:hypothetical protein